MRVPPHSMDHERAVLAACLVDRDSYRMVQSSLADTDWYAAKHTAIWQAMRAVAARGEPIDGMTVRAELHQRGQLDAVGGDQTLLDLAEMAVDSRAVDAYAVHIRQHARRRAIITALHECVSAGYDTATDYADWRATVERTIRATSLEDGSVDPTHISDVLARVIRETQEASAGRVVRGVSTGVNALDGHIGGWKPGKLYVVAGRPGMGKSALITSTVLARSDASILVASLEMPEIENGQRLLSAECSIDLRELSEARLSADSWRSMARACERLHTRHVYVDDVSRTLDQITGKARRHVLRHGSLSVLVVDYLQLVQGDKRLPREQQISEVTRELKVLSKELGCAVVALSQLNRECESRPDKRPRLSDLRESGAIEQDADVVMLLYRRGYYAAQAAETNAGKGGRWDAESTIAPGDDDGSVEIIIAKHRGGPQGIVRCRFVAENARFVD